MNPSERIPRPKGTTFLSQSLSDSPTTKQRKLKEHVLNLYFINNQTLLNKQYTIEQVAEYLCISTNEVLRYMTNKLGYLQGLGETTPEELVKVLLNGIRVLSSRIILGSLNHAQQADVQYVTLLASQGVGYKAFISSTVNDALRNNLASDSNLRETFKVMYQVASNLEPNPSQPTNHFLLPKSSKSHTQSQEDPNRSLTLSEAMEMVYKTGTNKLLEEPILRTKLVSEHNLDAMPEVRANYQSTGSQSEKDPIPDSKKLRKERHLTRRELEEGYVDHDEIT